MQRDRYWKLEPRSLWMERPIRRKKLKRAALPQPYGLEVSKVD